MAESTENKAEVNTSALFGLHSLKHAPGNRLNLVRRH
ncbi:hypothetical protein ABH944_008948 [Caballeronia udeis]|uniref:Uncharacterized protein n=1 Tax=Caballeronia udeis TaxID=1232866 RepID=A0ABW8MYP6_9BURK